MFFVARRKGLPGKLTFYLAMCLLCVWILFQNASSHSCFRVAVVVVVVSVAVVVVVVLHRVSSERITHSKIFNANSKHESLYPK